MRASHAARAFVWLWAACVSCAAVGIPNTGRADPPAAGPPRPRDGPFVIRLGLENDNLLFGNYGRLVGHEHDGNDLGRTHATRASVAYDWADRTRLHLGLSSQLFTASIDGSLPSRGAMIPLHFHELNRLRLGLILRRPNAPWRLRFGAAFEISNHEYLTIGASGQQDMWHDLLANTLRTGTWDFDHRRSSFGLTMGVAGDARAGGAVVVQLVPWFGLAFRGSAGLRLASIFAGSALLAQGGMQAIIGDPRGVRLVIGVEQRAYGWLESMGVMLRSTVEMRLDFEVAAFELALHRYDGDQNVAYFYYVFPNTTMNAVLTLRI